MQYPCGEAGIKNRDEAALEILNKFASCGNGITLNLELFGETVTCLVARDVLTGRMSGCFITEVWMF